ncbi:MAG: DUF4230 domain-containing protein [Gemmatimonadota bacterium]|nr:DUF4230 domain-containing protein [Gemmatimonadota bacterium]
MTTPDTSPRPRSTRHFLFGSAFSLSAVALIALIALGYCSSRVLPGIFGRKETRITNDVVIQQLRAVAKLVSTEATVRDVVVYENTWYGSTKRSLVIVTGKLFAGIDLANNPDVRIDDRNKKITVTIPSAQLIGVEITDLRTYDERGGLWNPFRPEDRDAIQRQAKTQLAAAGNTLAVLRHANESAELLLKTLLAKDGYSVDVTIRGAPPPPPPG